MVAAAGISFKLRKYFERTQNSLGKAQKEAEMRHNVLAMLKQNFPTRSIDSKW